MKYERKLAKRVIAMNPRNPAESAKYLQMVLEAEGYNENDRITLDSVRIAVAKEAAEIRAESERIAS